MKQRKIMVKAVSPKRIVFLIDAMEQSFQERVKRSSIMGDLVTKAQTVRAIDAIRRVDSIRGARFAWEDLRLARAVVRVQTVCLNDVMVSYGIRYVSQGNM